VASIGAWISFGLKNETKPKNGVIDNKIGESAEFYEKSEERGENGARRVYLGYYDSPSRLGVYKHAAVSTDSAPCAKIGE